VKGGVVALGLLGAALAPWSPACGRSAARVLDAGGSEAALVSAPSATAAGAARPGMVWIPPGEFRAGTPVGKTPRVPEEELPGTEIVLGGYYIDALPYPNEAGAIPTTNVARDEAARMCEIKGKRLCSELEWEHACKGPQGSTYEDGETYHASMCAMGVPAEESARRPSGEQLACKSGFGVRDMHGGPWEWTDGPWGRGSQRELGVLRGGNALAGEIAGRCANALARPPTTKSPTMGFRCCAGPKNEAKVDLALRGGPPLERSMKTRDFTAPLVPLASDTWSAPDAGSTFTFVHAFTWRPVPNEELVVATGCAKDKPHPRCGLLVARVRDAGQETATEAGAVTVDTLAHVDTGFEASEVAEVGDARHLRLKGLDSRGGYLRDFTYSYGRIETGPIQR
jgi:formylglycine-generating enzyme required for sulfatase activity